ncbi:MAG: hypothetical protein KJN99_06920, partial [Marinicaulis sp.]|nr:hypothetical protein [Marinicaulis sp.]
MGLNALFTVLLARKWILIQAVMVGALAALLVGLILPKEYRSTARVQVDSLQQNLLTGNFEPRVRVSEFLGQQAAIAGSRSVAVQVYDTLVAQGQLIESDLEAEWREATGGELVAGNDARLWAADKLLKKLEIEADAGQSTLTIGFKSEDPSQSARVANAFASQYMQSVLDQRQRRAARNAANFSGETESLEENIEQAQRDLTDFRQQSGIVGLGAQRLENSEVELAAVTMRLAEARADLSEAQSLLRQAREATGRELLTLPLSQEIASGRQAQSRLGSVLVQLQRLNDRYGPTYPSLIEADNERRALERTILKSVEDRAEFAERRVAALEANLQQKKTEVVALQETKQTY